MTQLMPSLFHLTDKQRDLINDTREFALAEIAPYAAQWDIDEHIPRKQVQKYADQGWFGMTLPEAYGGRDLSALDAVLIIEEVARHCGVSARITDFQNSQFKLADMLIDMEAARMLVYRAAAGAQATITDRTESSIAKVYASEMAIRVTSAAIQLLGGDGYSREHPLERMFRDARAFTLAGGTAEMQRLGIAVNILGRSIPQHA